MTTDDTAARRRISDTGILLELLDHLPTSIFVKDEDLRFVYSNEAHCNMIGQPEATLIGFSDADFYPASEAEAFLTRDRKVIDEGVTIEVEENATGSSGITMPVLTRKTRFTAKDGTAI